MMVQCYGSEFEIPDLLISKFVKDFSSLPGGSYREGVYQIRNSIEEITDMIAEDPDMLHEPEFLSDFLKALAMKQALLNLGILYDA
jgi:hypothetical protein